MKKNQSEKIAEKDILDEMLEGTSLADAEVLDVVTGENVCVILDGKMTVLELTKVINILSTLASDLTVILAQACGFCNNCGDLQPCEDSDNKSDCEATSCHNTPESWVAQCELCQSLLDGSGDVRIPDYTFDSVYTVAERAHRKVNYADKQILEENIMRRHSAFVAVDTETGELLEEEGGTGTLHTPVTEPQTDTSKRRTHVRTS